MKYLSFYLDLAVWGTGALITFWYAICTLRLVQRDKISYKMCSTLSWLIIVNSSMVLCSVVLLSFFGQSISILLLISFCTSDTIQMTGKVLLMWILTFNYYRASLEMPVFLTVNNLKEHNQMISGLRQRKLIKSNEPRLDLWFHIGVTVIIVTLVPCWFLTDFMFFYKENSPFWINIAAGIYYYTCVLLLAISMMMGTVVNRIWNKLKLNPSLQRNERIMWALLTICISYGFLYLVSAIFFDLQASNPSVTAYDMLRWATSSLRGVF